MYVCTVKLEYILSAVHVSDQLRGNCCDGHGAEVVTVIWELIPCWA